MLISGISNINSESVVRRKDCTQQPWMRLSLWEDGYNNVASIWEKNGIPRCDRIVIGVPIGIPQKISTPPKVHFSLDIVSEVLEQSKL